MSYDFAGCARRLGTVLMGHTEPSVHAVTEAAAAITGLVCNAVGSALRAVYDETLAEGVPQEFTEILARLPEDGAPKNGGGHAPH